MRAIDELFSDIAQAKKDKKAAKAYYGKCSEEYVEAALELIELKAELDFILLHSN